MPKQRYFTADEPSSRERTEAFQALLPQVVALHEELTAQARARPLLEAPLPVCALAKSLLIQVDRAMRASPAKAYVPNLSAETVSFSELALVLGQARTAFYNFGEMAGLSETGAKQVTSVEAVREKLAQRLSRLTTEDVDRIRQLSIPPDRT